ncbi:SLIT-ROBO Rho GTPase-activating protein 3, partial [Goodea atripinnis]
MVTLGLIPRNVLTVLCCCYYCRKDQHLLSSVNCWYLLLNQTRRESRDHATLSDIYTNNVIVRLAQISEDVIRLFKKVSETVTSSLLVCTN